MFFYDIIGSSSFILRRVGSFECVKVPMPAHQVLPLTGNIFEASYGTSATQANKIKSIDQLELFNL